MRAAPKRSVLPPLDENGLLLDPHLWDESIAQALADHHGVGPLGTEHWQVIFGPVLIAIVLSARRGIAGLLESQAGGRG